MRTKLRQGEQVIKEGAANLQVNLETVGGKLYLTNQRLVFEAHWINIQSGTTELELSRIQMLEKCWTKFLGFVPLFRNSLVVYMEQGNEYHFVLSGYEAWKASIELQISG